MKFTELQQKSMTELTELLAQKRNEIRELRAKASEGQLKDVRSLRLAKKMVAHIITAIKQSAKKDV